jgi:hypothetical protein
LKLSTSGLELSGFPTWIIFIVLGVAVAAFVVWYFLLRSEKERFSRFLIPLGALAALSVIALSVLAGYWRGREDTRTELREIIGRSTEIAIPAPQPTPQATVQTIPQLTPTPEADIYSRFYLPGFMLLSLLIAGFTVHIFMASLIRLRESAILREAIHRAEHLDIHLHR